MTSTYNYGATLQAFALQDYIENIGYSCDVIDHMGWTGHRTISLKKFSKETILAIPYKRSLERGYGNFEKFYEEYMHMTRRYSSISELYFNPPESDLFITGSDQVWNPRDFRNEFYLDFAPEGTKKISYAASIGISDIPEEKKTDIKKFLNDFDAISVRENNGKEQLKSLTDKPISVNCDPVFLLNEEKWASIATENKQIKDDYILCYLIYKPEWFNEWARAVKKTTGLKIVFVGLQGYRRVFCDYFVRDAGPREFVGLIKNAKYVVTSSFHGTVFSIIFGKPFVAIPDPPRPDRIHNLLGDFNLQDRELYENKTDCIFQDYSHISIKEIVESEQKKTKDYFESFFKT